MAGIVPFTEARASLTELLDAVDDKQEHVLITRNGRRLAMMLSPDEYESLEETLDILQDKDPLEARAKARRMCEQDASPRWTTSAPNVADGSGPTDPASRTPL